MGEHMMSIRPGNTKRTRPLGLILVLSALVFAPEQAQSKTKAPLQPEGVGILLLAHGGSKAWNDEVIKVAAELNKDTPVELAFGMADKRTIQEGIDKLVARGAKEVVAVPLFISSNSSVITSTAYLLGLRKDAPTDLALFAKMDHSSMGGGSMANMETGPITPVKSPLPIRMTAALDHHVLVADILRERAKAISQAPANEVVILVAHGPVPDDDNAKWLADMKILAQSMKTGTSYKRIEYLTVRDDASDPVRAQATSELRTRVETAIREGNKVLIVPLVLSYGGIEGGIRKRLEGLDYTLSKFGLLPDERIVRWVRESASQQTSVR
jgi:sirohydrochlorin ferrochelatase